jgi:hypothetical protein
MNASTPGQNVSHGDHDDIAKTSVGESNNFLVSICKSPLKYHTEPRSYTIQKEGGGTKLPHLPPLGGPHKQQVGLPRGKHAGLADQAWWCPKVKV